MVDFSGLKALLAILEWLWCVMADQVNYPEYPAQEVDDALWPEWDWALRNAQASDFKAPWSRRLHSWFIDEQF